MNKKILLIFFVLSAAISTNAQIEGKRIDIRFGLGASLLGTGDVVVDMYEAELNRKFSRYFTFAVTSAFGKGGEGEFNTSAFVQSNVNAFISPFRNNRRNDFSIGVGLSFFDVSGTYLQWASYENGILKDYEIATSKRQTFGGNLIIENTYSVTERFLLGIKVFTQPYINGDINSGILLKFGVTL